MLKHGEKKEGNSFIPYDPLQLTTHHFDRYSLSQRIHHLSLNSIPTVILSSLLFQGVGNYRKIGKK
jgi:hypothetical protein